MSTNIRKLIKSLNNGKNLDNDLPAYVEMLAEEYHDYALIQVMMQYYVMCEQYEDGFFKEEEVFDTVHFIREMIEEVFEKGADRDTCISRLEEERTKVIRKMEVLTNYTDQLMIYEYILNRLEYKFDPSADLEKISEEDTVFAQQLLQYILSVKDNYVVNEKIKDIIGQLPIRMARSRFFELVKNSITLYKGSEKDSLDSYLYVLRTSATLYEPEAEGTYFKDWREFAEKLKTVDFENLEQAEFDALFDELKEKAQDIADASEVFVTLQELINSLCVYLLFDKQDNANNKVAWEKETELCKDVIATIIERRKDGADSVISEELMEKLEQLEGAPEKIMMHVQQLTGSFQMAKEAYAEKIQELGLDKEFDEFEKAETLLSSSIFVEFKEKSLETVTDEMAEKETVKLVEEFSQLFKENSIRFVRAVIACVISRMPVFFTNIEEVSEYIQSSLSQCRDVAEKKASYELLRGMLVESDS